ncbi:unnamed protein product, partial [Medioppia subpectinata]
MAATVAMDHTMTTMGGMDMDMDMGMKMYFHTGYEKMVLFEHWMATTPWGMIGACVFFFVLGVIYEGLKYYRQFLALKAQSLLTIQVHEESGNGSTSTATPDSPISSADKYDRPLHTTDCTVRPAIRRLSFAHIYQTALHMIQMLISYVLMLGVMTFNVWLCLAVILGAGCGYFLVGTQKPSTSSAFSDHCH